MSASPSTPPHDSWPHGRAKHIEIYRVGGPSRQTMSNLFSKCLLNYAVASCRGTTNASSNLIAEGSGTDKHSSASAIGVPCRCSWGAATGLMTPRWDGHNCQDFRCWDVARDPELQHMSLTRGHGQASLVASGSPQGQRNITSRALYLMLPLGKPLPSWVPHTDYAHLLFFPPQKHLLYVQKPAKRKR